MSRFVLITPDLDFESRLSQAVSGLPGGLQSFRTPALPEQPEDLLHLLDAEPLEVLILGPGVGVDAALRLTTLLGLQHPDVSVLISAQPSTDSVLQALRAGARDVVDPVSGPADLGAAIDRASRASAAWRRAAEGVRDAAGEQRGTVVTVASPKGGVGKTTLATNLAVGLAQTAPLGVAIVDLDLQFGDVASALYASPEHTITDAVSPAATQDPLVLKTFLTPHASGLYAICAPRTPVDAEAISPTQVGHLIDQLAQEFAYVVLDTPTGTPETVLTALEHSSDVLLATTADVPAVRGLRLASDLWEEMGILPGRQHRVLNMAEARFGLSVPDIEATLGAHLDVAVPRSRGVAHSTNRGVPLLVDTKRDPALKALRSMVQRFTPSAGATSTSRHRQVVVA